MKTVEAIERRKSIREFSNKPVKFDKIMEVVDAANHAPFAGNINNLKFVLVELEENKNFIAENAQQLWVADASWVVIVCSELKKLTELYNDHALTYAKQQAGAAIENMLLRATELGLATCWVGAFAEGAIKARFRIPDDWSIEALIPISYPKHKIKKPTRKTALENTLFWEQWNVKKKPPKYPGPDPTTYYEVGHKV